MFLEYDESQLANVVSGDETWIKSLLLSQYGHKATQKERLETAKYLYCKTDALREVGFEFDNSFGQLYIVVYDNQSRCLK